MNKQRDELAREIFIADNYHARREFMEAEWAERSGGYQYAFWIADGLIASGYAKPRTITTVEELKTVYAGCLIRESNGDLWSIEPSTERLFMLADGMDDTYDDDALTLPAVVLYEPQP